MTDSQQPTPEQRAAWRNALTMLPDDNLGAVANEAIPALDAEVDRLTFELSAAREDHNATKTGWERAAAELHHADERVRDAERLGRALRGELDECTRERDEARAELAALRAAVQVGEGERYLRVRLHRDDTGQGVVAIVGVDHNGRGDWYVLGPVPRSAIVTFPSCAAPAPAGSDVLSVDGIVAKTCWNGIRFDATPPPGQSEATDARLLALSGKRVHLTINAFGPAGADDSEETSR